MKTTQDLTANPQALVNAASSSEQPTKPNRSLPSQRQRKLVSALWTRMTQLYRHKWQSSEGDILDGENYSSTFLTWCAKTSHLGDEEWAKGMAKLERKVTADAANGNESWPPSYAEFTGYCRPTTSPDGKNSAAYIAFDDPKHPSYEKPKGIEDLTSKEQRIAQGRAFAQDILKSL